MDALPEALLVEALGFADAAALLAAECTSHHLRRIVQDQGVWEKLARRFILTRAGDEPVSVVQWKQLAVTVTQLIDSSRSLLDDVTACSSTNDPHDAPTNTLTISPCWMQIRHLWNRIGDHEQKEALYVRLAGQAQSRHQCPTGPPCYWNALPSLDPNTQDFIEYSVAPLSLVRVVQIMPVQAFNHPGQPTYKPRAVSLQFYTIPRFGSGDKELLYKSPKFTLENEMQLNEFKLPQAVWFVSLGIMRLNLHGRVWRSPVNGGIFGRAPVPEYLLRISYVGALGNPLLEA